MTDNTIDKLAAGLKDQLKVDAAPFVPASASATNNNSDGKKSNNNNNNKAPQKRNNRGPRNKKPKETTAKQDNETGGSDAPVEAAVVKESNAKNKGKKWKNKDTAGKSKSSPSQNNEKQSTTTTGPNKSEKKSKPSNNNQDKQQSDGPENKSEKKNKPNTDNKGQQQQGKDKSTANKGKSKAHKKKQNNPPRVDNGDEKQVVEDAASKQSQKQQDKTKKAAKPNKKSAPSSSTSLSSSASTNKQSTIPPNQPQTTNDLNYGAGRPIKVVHIAEKPSIGQAIAVGLGGGGNSKSFGKSLPVHEFTDNSPFPKAPKASKVTHVVSSVAGHVFNVDFPTEFQSWDTVDPAELFHAPVVKKPCKGSVVKHLQEITKGADFLVLWMDCDREGENINFEVLECCMHLMAGSGSKFDRVYRAHFSAINPSDIKKAYNALGKPDRCQSLSVDARQELDLKVGVAFSRFQTRYFQGRYGDLDSAVLSYGPCQTPTLGFCVQRHLEMETFKPEPYWLLDLGIMNSGTMCRAVWDSGRSFNRNKVDGYIAKCRDANPASVAKVISVTTKDKNQGRPVPLNTVALLKACSKALGIGPHSALQIAERLYLSGYLSYPRTESTRYPKSFDIAGTLQDQLHDNRWGSYVRDLLKDGFNVAKGGVDMGDHPPITPCRHARAGELSGDMARVYDLVARHFIASVSHDAKWRSTTVKISIEELDEKGTFTIRGKTLISPGFLAIMLHNQYGDEREDDPFGEEEEEEKALPEFQEGDLYGLFFSGSKKSGSGDKVSVAPAGKFCTLDIKEKMTTPPTYLTESELISRMEKHGIGTDASISTHIENILKRYYVELIPGRKLKPTKLGLVLAQGYHLIDDSLVLPKIRSDIEDQCNKIAKGLAERDEVVRKAIDLFSAKFTYFVDNVSKMDVLFGSSFARLQDVGKPFTRCGLTRRYLQFIAGPPPRLYNKTTESVYVLPIGGEIKQWTGRNCPVDGCNFELCLYSVGAPPRTFPLCPNCFNNPKPEWGPIPGEDTTPTPGDEEDENKERNIRRMAGKNMIRECPHPDKMPLIEEMTVSPDPESNGVLILDPHLGPKWRLVSTREPTIVHMPKSVEKVTVLDTKDEVLGCRMMSIEFKEGESPLEGGKKKYTSCFANDEILQGLVRIHHGDERMKASSRGGRGRGRGGGRGGRGRGRGGRGRR